MKHIITAYFSICLCLLIRGQNEYFQNNPRWIIHYNCNPIPVDYSYNVFYGVTGDTLLNNHVYKIISADEYHIVRSEDTQVFRWDEGTEQERLIYNFMGEVGDTLEVSEMVSEQTLIIQELDSVWINSEWRTVFTLGSDYPIMAPILIEGVGNSVTGLFGIIDAWMDCGIQTTCYSVGNFSYNWDSSGESFNSFEEIEGPCSTGILVSQTEQASINVFPNPCTDFIQITGFAQNPNIKIKNTMGHVLITECCQQQIDVSFLATGIYFIEIIAHDRRSILRFVKV